MNSMRYRISRRDAPFGLSSGPHQALPRLLDPQLALSSEFKAATNALQATGSP